MEMDSHGGLEVTIRQTESKKKKTTQQLRETDPCDDDVIDPWMKATRYGRVDFAKVCSTSDSLLSGTVTSVGGRAVQYSHGNGFDLTTKAGTDKLKQDLLDKRPGVVWMTPPSTTQRTQQSQSRSKFQRTQLNILLV